MNFILGFFVGLLVGGIVFYFVYKNNKTKLDTIAKKIEEEVSESKTIASIKELLK
jgi:uncharacterized membrane protein YciS (DUF1049 family)